MYRSLALLPFMLGAANAICGGFNFAIGSTHDLGKGFKRWDVYNDNCKVVDGLTTNKDPCTSGTFGCSSSGLFDEYTNSFSGMKYACRKDPSSGKCGKDVISVCCRNDGN